MKRLILSMVVMLALAACNEDDDADTGDNGDGMEDSATESE
jgi:hypothetical protein